MEKKKITVSRKKAKIFTVNRKSHYPIETLLKRSFAAWAASVCLHFRPTCLFGCVVFERLFTLHSFFYSFLCRP